MADIIIKGMDMPKTCCDCDLKSYDPEKRWDENGIEQIGAWVCKRTRELIWNTKRGDNCPLGSLPEGHGKMIDLDALMNDLKNLVDRREKDAAFSGDRGPSVTWDDAICSIFAAPIIVPAEGGVDNG